MLYEVLSFGDFLQERVQEHLRRCGLDFSASPSDPVSCTTCKLALMLVSLSWGINAFASFCSSFLNTFIPINFLRKILNVINLLLLLHSAVRVEKQRFVEWFWLIELFSVLSSLEISSLIIFRS